MIDTDWTQTKDELPPEGVEVMALNGGHVQTLKRRGRLWWFPDGSMYVYFVPKLWKHIAADCCGCSCSVCANGHAAGVHTLSCSDRATRPTPD